MEEEAYSQTDMDEEANNVPVKTPISKIKILVIVTFALSITTIILSVTSLTLTLVYNKNSNTNGPTPTLLTITTPDSATTLLTLQTKTTPDSVTTLLTTLTSVVTNNPTTTVLTASKCGVPFYKPNIDIGNQRLSFNQDQKRIINDSTSFPHSWPWMISLRPIVTLRHSCSGMIVDDKFVITAAHCVYGRKAEDLVVGVGLHRASEFNLSNAFYVRNITVNENYNSTFFNDIALIELSKAIVFTNEVMPICLPDSNSEIVGKKVIVTGWNNSLTSDELQEAVLYVANNESVCIDSNMDMDKFYCVLDPDPNQVANKFQGDSGGPIVLQRNDTWYLYGITSFVNQTENVTNPRKRLNEYPSFFTKVPIFVAWLNENLVSENLTTSAPTTSTASTTRTTKTVGPTVPFTKRCGIPSYKPNIDLENGKIGKIINGQEAAEHSWPWMVSLRSSVTLRHSCGGILIDEKFVLTAAHCVYGKVASDILLGFGLHKASEFNVNDASYAINLTIHEKYNSTYFYVGNDIALIELKEALNFSSEIMPICLPSQDSEIYGRKVVTAGWGRNSTTAVGADALQETVMYIANNESVCIEDGQNLKLLYCILDPNPEQASNVCNGDSGGPLFLSFNNTFYVYGVTSFVYADQSVNPPRCLNNFPSFFSKVPPFVNWIYSKIQPYNTTIATTKPSTTNTRPPFINKCGSPSYKPNYDFENTKYLPQLFNDNYADRIINGQEAAEHSWPWMVSLRSSLSLRHFCGGSLVNERFILTAAHCVYGTAASSVLVGVGLHKSSDFTLSDAFYVKKITIHESYNSTFFYLGYDIALIELTTPVTFSSEVAPICLPPQTYEIIGKKVVTAGWGRYNPLSSVLADLLQETVLYIANNQSICANYSYNNLDKLYCVLDPDANKASATCNGDSGGPLFFQLNSTWYVYGITSFGYVETGSNPPKCLTNIPSFFTNVPVYTDWIIAKIDLQNYTTTANVTTITTTRLSNATGTTPTITFPASNVTTTTRLSNATGTTPTITFSASNATLTTTLSSIVTNPITTTKSEVTVSFTNRCGAPSYTPNLDINNEDSDISLLESDRIINGQEAAEHSWPWMVSLRSIVTLRHFCGGILIHEKYVLTAAHCVYGKRASDIVIGVGLHKSSDFNLNNNAVYAENITIHEDYNSTYFYFGSDIALIELKEYLTLTSEISTICLPTSTSEIYGKNVVVSGWGRNNSATSTLADSLQESLMYIANNETVCEETELNLDLLYCILDPDTNKTANVCNGDSGGPIFTKFNDTWYVYGVASFVFTEIGSSPPKCLNDSPSFFTKVTIFVDWILERII